MLTCKVTLEKQGVTYLLSIHHEMGVEVTDLYFRCPSYRAVMTHEFEGAILYAGTDNVKPHYGKRCNVKVYADAVELIGENGYQLTLFADEMICEGLRD